MRMVCTIGRELLSTMEVCVSFRRTLSIALAFIGLLVGAGFATGQEVIQYFVAAGSKGLIGAAVAGAIIAGAGLVILQLGSYFQADEHNKVFTSISHAVVARFLDIAVIITLFAFGFVMLAGAGSTLTQQFGWPAWIGSTVMLGLVLISGLLDVEKITDVIGALTPLVIIMVIVAFGYSMTQLPIDTEALSQAAATAEMPVTPWWLSAVNYAGLALILGVSMVLVIGGNYLDPREAGVGGLAGGVVYMVLLLMAAVSIYINIDDVVGADVPMLALFQQMQGWTGYIIVFIVFAMIYNTCIGMFYALGRRLAAGKQSKFRMYFTITAVVGWAVSFIGFQDLMGVVYPALGYLGVVLVSTLVIAYLRERPKISAESQRRVRIRQLFYKHEHPDKGDLTEKEERELATLVEQSPVENEDLQDTVTEEVVQALDSDSDVEYSADEEGKRASFDDISTINNRAGTN
ncbi:hypothetical protein HMPREF1219_00380 [Corynebacterium pyruviciproducens ATCC BAA-1742]|uniref:Membrane protein YkvI n=1 Tax=Corynebacterium pyruviciproducens ATCC BAA-1742 TaxID=1125779 RepID=S2Z1I9_9CORY|nr:hypothetical protein HMPREF1219_00380 [Corynebacterium pyruviciproducens ATCC BAA-1742]